jgi:hypothetical protein
MFGPEDEPTPIHKDEEGNINIGKELREEETKVEIDDEGDLEEEKPAANFISYMNMISIKGINSI